MSDKKETPNNEYFDQVELVRTLRNLIRAAEKLPDTPLRDAIWGGLEIALEEALKPVRNPADTVH